VADDDAEMNNEHEGAGSNTYDSGHNTQQRMFGSKKLNKKLEDEQQTVTPTTIAQLLHAQYGADEKFRIDNQEVHTVYFVGKIMRVDTKPTNTTFVLDDSTGQIDVQLWAETLKQLPEDPASWGYVYTS